jgi:hypothetical protein
VLGRNGSLERVPFPFKKVTLNKFIFIHKEQGTERNAYFLFREKLLTIPILSELYCYYNNKISSSVNASKCTLHTFNHQISGSSTAVLKF